MATIKNFTSVEQSKKLAEILPLESADMCYRAYREEGGILDYFATLCPYLLASWVGIPCWSLTALLGVLPDELEDNHFLTLSKEGAEYCCCYEDINGNSFRHTFADNPVDACYEMIIRLNELKVL